METGRIVGAGKNAPSRIRAGEHPLEFLKRVREEAAVKDLAYAELEKVRASTDFGTKYLEEGG